MYIKEIEFLNNFFFNIRKHLLNRNLNLTLHHEKEFIEPIFSP